MKHTIQIFLSTILASSLLTAAQPYVEGTYQNMTAQSENVLGVQPQSELIGKELNIFKLSAGLEANNPEGEWTTLNGSKAGFYLGLSNDYESDIAFGIDFTLTSPKFKWGIIAPYFGGGIGFGTRSDGGSNKAVSTSVNKVSFITEDHNTLGTPTIAHFNKDTSYIQTFFSIGVQAQISQNVKFKGGYVYNKNSYELNYTLANSPGVENAIDSDARYNGFEVSLELVF